VRKRFPKSVLIEGVGGTTHAGSLNGIACTDDAIAAYLSDGTLPARVRGNRSDKQCARAHRPAPPVHARSVLPIRRASQRRERAGPQVASSAAAFSSDRRRRSPSGTGRRWRCG
jgi:hypothetical protein